MRKEERAAIVLSYLRKTYPDAKCALNFHNDYECLFAIALSAQTSDESVNKVTPGLFSLYPDVGSLAKADEEEVRRIISSLGLAKTKAHNLVRASGEIVSRFRSQIPVEMNELTSLPGIGHKTASVFLLERKDVPAIPVDTHVGRLSKRLGFAKEEDGVIAIQGKLERLFPREDWHFVHLALISHGRARCLSLSPRCKDCELAAVCPYFRKKSSTRDR